MQSASPVAVVTGGTGGIGAAICRALAYAGFTVVVGYRSSAAAAYAAWRPSDLPVPRIRRRALR